MNPLLALHNAIAAVCPITGVADNGDGTYTVRYDPSATATQQSAVQAAVAAWPLAWQKLQAQALVSQWDSQQRAAGISVTAPAGETITLLADADSQNLIVGGVAMLNNEEVLQPAHIATIEATNISQIFGGAPLARQRQHARYDGRTVPRERASTPQCSPPGGAKKRPPSWRSPQPLTQPPSTRPWRLSA